MKIDTLTVTTTLILLLTTMSSLTLNLTSTAHGSAIISVPDDYPTIQESVNAANPGDTIMIASGIYYEHITISKSHLTLLGENPSSTIIDGNGTGPIFYLSANDTTIMRFTIRNSGEDELEGKSGLYIKCAYGNTITNNVYYDCWIGIEIEGTMQQNSWSNKIIRNTVIDNNIGILLIKFAVANTVSENTVTNSSEGIHLTAYSGNNTIDGNTITNNEYGIYLSHSEGNVISGNILTQNGYGIHLSGNLATRNIVKYNVIANNEYGIHGMYPSNSNIVYLNNFIQNTNQVNFDVPTLTFTWDNGAEGNYWSDYKGNDSNGDGIGETPYIINAKNRDNYPFMKMWGWVKGPSYIKEAILLAVGIVVTAGIAMYFLRIRKKA
jgi:parallel beta-helix repeat protein